MTTWLAVRGWVPAAAEDETTVLAGMTGAVGAEVGEPCDGRIELVVYVESDAAIAPVQAGFATLGGSELEVTMVAERDWLAGYRSAVRPFAVGRRWWVDPHPDSPSAAPDGRLRLVIEPRMAFGSGSHESTRLVLLELEARPPTGRAVLDVGTGSGILALAAERLGATTVVGFDIDPEAIWVARQTVALQEWRSAVVLYVGTLAVVAGRSFDVMLCNMISEHFLPLAGALRERLAAAGEVVFSGVLAAEEDRVRRRLAAIGLRVVSVRCDGEWRALRVTHG